MRIKSRTKRNQMVASWLTIYRACLLDLIRIVHNMTPDELDMLANTEFYQDISNSILWIHNMLSEYNEKHKDVK